MQGDASLTLIVPGMGRALAQTVHALEMPQLSQLAARGSLRYAWDRSDLAQAAHCAWQRGLLWALQLAPAAHPSAALCAVAHGHSFAGSESASTWLHLEPVHLAAGLNHLSLVELGNELQPTPAQRAALEPQVREHLQGHGMSLHVCHSGEWLVQASLDPALRTVCPAAAAANELELALPQGEGRAALRRLMTELQMLLHEHPVNQQRARQGLPEVNALWPWGNGALPAAAARALPVAFAAHDYLRGIHRHYGNDTRPVPASGTELLAVLAGERGARQALVVLDAPAPEQFEQTWLGPLVRALRARRLMRLDLILDGWHLSIDRRSLWRFWRRPLPPGSWVA